MRAVSNVIGFISWTWFCMYHICNTEFCRLSHWSPFLVPNFISAGFIKKSTTVIILTQGLNQTRLKVCCLSVWTLRLIEGYLQVPAACVPLCYRALTPEMVTGRRHFTAAAFPSHITYYCHLLLPASSRRLQRLWGYLPKNRSGAGMALIGNNCILQQALTLFLTRILLKPLFLSKEFCLINTNKLQ